MSAEGRESVRSRLEWKTRGIRQCRRSEERTKGSEGGKVWEGWLIKGEEIMKG